ncbi:uncharacterized protein DUF3311 [Alicyclobacillus sacchari]|uniref:Uncharacterized protein DUF3311 n=1 Tax=Alicyclobacillus sacchari TaxID=392010 RepID=A0A4R8LMY0_9BACL|nr:DUF3311 domain-containing protein [Alicyclobacillus sacchari]TDY46259.1 uncharacterized protein DUF3311 [Alicyclobacillus sacchari]GMA57248.1 hypothetical protein GCM10025858_17510 [Alicyclobacillus sacchari]
MNKPNHTASHRRRWWYLLVFIPLIGTLFPQFYASASPTLWGIPLFYWYQMMWVIISAIITGFLYFILQDD